MKISAQIPIHDELVVETVAYVEKILTLSHTHYVIICGQSEFIPGLIYNLGAAGAVSDDRVFIGYNSLVTVEDPLVVYGEDYYNYTRGYVSMSDEPPVNGTSA
ncbi:hypothetical protein HDU99_003361, partial [Rhizoclosmatium hyalinum]